MDNLDIILIITSIILLISSYFLRKYLNQIQQPDQSSGHNNVKPPVTPPPVTPPLVTPPLVTPPLVTPLPVTPPPVTPPPPSLPLPKNNWTPETIKELDDYLNVFFSQLLGEGKVLPIGISTGLKNVEQDIIDNYPYDQYKNLYYDFTNMTSEIYPGSFKLTYPTDDQINLALFMINSLYKHYNITISEDVFRDMRFYSYSLTPISRADPNWAKYFNYEYENLSSYGYTIMQYLFLTIIYLYIVLLQKYKKENIDHIKTSNILSKYQKDWSDMSNAWESTQPNNS